MHADGSRSVTLHSTEIIRHWPAKRAVALCTGGWNTATTRTRMNQALSEWNIPASVSMARGVASVRIGGTDRLFVNSAVKFNY